MKKYCLIISFLFIILSACNTLSAPVLDRVYSPEAYSAEDSTLLYEQLDSLIANKISGTITMSIFFADTTINGKTYREILGDSKAMKKKLGID